MIPTSSHLRPRLPAPPVGLAARQWGALALVAGLAALLLALAAMPALAADSATKASRQSWLRLDSPHFTLFSATDAGTARRVGQDLETLRAALSFWLDGEEVHSPVPTTIYVFADDRSFLPYKQGVRGEAQGVAGYFISHPLGNYVALDGSPRADPSRILYHEYLHYFIANNLPGVPLWFNEGLAEFYSTFEARGDRVELGRPLEHHLRWMQRHPNLSLADLFAVGVESDEYNESSRRGGFYAQSWALVHYLMVGDGERSEQLIRFLEQVVAGVEVDDAFHQAFDTDYRTLERELEAYLAQPSLPGLQLSVAGLKAATVPGTVTDLPRAETLYRLGDLLAYAAPRRAEAARSHFLEALELDPRHGGAWAGLGYLEDQTESWDDARGYYERALELAFGDFRIHYLYGRNLLAPWVGRRLTAAELEGRAEREIAAARGAFQRSLGLNPDFPEAWVGLGAAYALEPEASERGLEALKQARRLLPSRGDVVFNLAVTYARLGRREEARAVIERDLARLGDEQMVEAATEAVLRADLEHASELLEAGRVEPALALLEEISELTSDPVWRLDLLRQLEQVRSVERHNRQVDRFNAAVQAANSGRSRDAQALVEDLLEEDLDPQLERSARSLLDQLRAKN
ncbi:MAG: tetratricopeptide repeat protein [Acidobacteriota bacterium]|nr:tetratricopeptide repeat protein [Acidobacteriota bacterium]